MTSTDLVTSNYSIHDINLRFNTNSEYIYSSVNEPLRAFRAKRQLSGIDINFTLNKSSDKSVVNFSLPEKSKLLYTPSKNDKFDIKLFDLQTFNLYIDVKNPTYYIDLGYTGFLSYNLVSGTASGYLHKPELINPVVLSSSIFLFVLDQLLKSKNYFPLHCSTVEKNGKGVLLPGFSGSGKTTSCIALIRKGFGFLSDDRPILRRNKKGILEVLSFPEDINVTQKTVNFFPELAGSKFINNNWGAFKNKINAEKNYPGSQKDRCYPKVILYPEISNEKKCFLEELSKSDALSLLLPHSMLVFDKETSKRHFDILFDLIISADTYRLKLGTDILDLPDLVESIL
ncbi:MAG: hypothetical protein JRJ27_17105 [Deltaproteobacteria bacterium]|nr:hypothetical protein [Deltaproteobacteria bacterium]